MRERKKRPRENNIYISLGQLWRHWNDDSEIRNQNSNRLITIIATSGQVNENATYNSMNRRQGNQSIILRIIQHWLILFLCFRLLLSEGFRSIDAVMSRVLKARMKSVYKNREKNLSKNNEKNCNREIKLTPRLEILERCQSEHKARCVLSDSHV